MTIALSKEISRMYVCVFCCEIQKLKLLSKMTCHCVVPLQKWNLQKSACDEGVKIELRPVLAQFRANLSFPALRMLLSGL